MGLTSFNYKSLGQNKTLANDKKRIEALAILERESTRSNCILVRKNWSLGQNWILNEFYSENYL